MAWICKFVDAISATPNTLLDLNNADELSGRNLPGSIQVDADGFDFGWPELRRSLSSSTLADGEWVSTDSYGNRTLKVPLFLYGNASQVSDNLTKIARRLNRRRSLLMVKPDDLNTPIFFRTLRSSISDGDVRDAGAGVWRVTLSIMAEPFGWGLQESFSLNPTNTIANLKQTLPTIKGDVAAPLRLWYSTLDAGSSTAGQTGIAMVNVAYSDAAIPTYLQDTNTSFGADTGSSTSDTSAEGSKFTTTFATAAGFASRVIMNGQTLPRGSYRAFARVQSSVAGTNFDVACQVYGGTTFLAGSESKNWVAPTSGGWYGIDLGLVDIPPWQSIAVWEDEWVVGITYNLNWFAGRNSGTGNLDLDYIALIPQDVNAGGPPSSTALILHPGDAGSSFYGVVLDTQTDSARFAASPTNLVIAPAQPEVSGGLPYVIPGYINTLFVLPNYTDSTIDINKTFTTSMQLSYYPRYLMLKPSAL